MKIKFAICLASLPVFWGLSIPADAVQINFTGGTVVRNDATTETTSNSIVWDNVDYYEEGGFRLDFISGGAGGFESNIGDTTTAPATMSSTGTGPQATSAA